VLQSPTRMFERIGKGLYGFSEAARLTGLPSARLRSWFFSQSDFRKPVLTPDYQPVQGSYAISFLDLIDARVASALKETGLSTQKVRRIYGELQEMLSERHPFAREELLHDGANVWVKVSGKLGEERFIEILKRQHGIPIVVKSFLKTLSYDGRTSRAFEWNVGKGVAVNPDFCFGKPATIKSRRPTRILADAYAANGEDESVVAAWYGVDEQEVRDAVRFEGRQAA
jgi:uncharacterized protein (DUF433 family)